VAILMRKVNMKKYNQGYALILVVAVLATLMIIQITFMIAANFESINSNNQVLSNKASYLAEAGLNKAVSELKAEAANSFLWVDSDASNEYYMSYEDATLLSSKGKYSVTVADCSSRINLNDTSNANLNQVLAALPGISSLANANAIITYRNGLGGGMFETKEQLRQVSGITYDSVKNYITTKSYIDHSTNRSPVNVNAADAAVLEAVFTYVLNDSTKASTLAADIVSNKRADPFDDWNEFDGFIDARAYLNAADKTNLKINCNPNRDKSLITRLTTELCFCAGGYFEINSTGYLYATPAQNTQLASKEISAIIKTHQIICDTLKSDWCEDLNYNGSLDAGEDTNGDGNLTFPTWSMVNWQDSCPVTSDYDEGLNCASGYETIPDSIKLGFWDNFDEDNDNTNEEGWSWYNWSVDTGTMNITAAGTSNNKMHGSGAVTNGFILDKAGEDVWKVADDFSLRIYAKDPAKMPGEYANYEDAGTIECIKEGQTYAKLWLSTFGYLWQPWGMGWARYDITRVSSTVDSDPAGNSTPVGGKDFFDSQLKLSFLPSSGDARDRFLHITDFCYGISPCATDHRSNWIDDEDNDEYHGAVPVEMTYRLSVYDTAYKVEVAVGRAWAYRFDYDYVTSGNNYTGRDEYLPADNDYTTIPLDTQTDNYYDRYGFWSINNGGDNIWRTSINGWNLKLYSKDNQTKWDEVRIIVPEGSFESADWLIVDEDNNPVSVTWAAINWTETIPSTASSDSEDIDLNINTGAGYAAVTLNQGINIDSTTLNYKADFTSDESDLYETPVLEDVTVIYILPETQIFYWKEL
jgi:type II secretory pathway component PulK